MGLAWTGMQHAEIPSGLGSVIFGWTTAFSAVTTSGATLTVTPNFDFSTLKFSFQTTAASDGNRRFAIYPAIPDPAVANPSNIATDWQVKTDARLYSGLYGASGIFTTANTFAIIKDTMATSTTIQFTMYLHRVNILTDPANSNGYHYTTAKAISGSLLFINSADPTYNTVVAGSLGLVGIVGYSAFWNNGTSKAALDMEVNYNTPVAMTIWSDGYRQALEDFSGLFYSLQCHASCVSCSGVLPNQCSTCAQGLNPLEGSCTCEDGQYESSDESDFLCTACDPSCTTCDGGTANNCLTCPDGSTAQGGSCTPDPGDCPSGCTTCTSPTACTACDTRYYRVSAPDGNNMCPCINGFYEDASQNCVPCPSTQHCETCQLSGENVICLTCRCSNHREIVDDQCSCISGYEEDGNNPGAYCKKIVAR